MPRLYFVDVEFTQVLNCCGLRPMLLLHLTTRWGSPFASEQTPGTSNKSPFSRLNQTLLLVSSTNAPQHSGLSLNVTSPERFDPVLFHLIQYTYGRCGKWPSACGTIKGSAQARLWLTVGTQSALVAGAGRSLSSRRDAQTSPRASTPSPQQPGGLG